MSNNSDRLMDFSFREFFFVVVSVLGFLLILYLGRTLLVPLAFGLLISFILHPISSWIESKGIKRLWAAFWTILSVTLVVLGLITLFSAQIVGIIREFGGFKEKLIQTLNAVTTYIKTHFPFISEIESSTILQQGKEWITESGGVIMTGTLGATSMFLSGTVLAVIYTFLFLLYRRGLRKSLTHFVPGEYRDRFSEMCREAQQVGQKYLTGMFILILILGALNSLGLFLLGIEYSLFFGYLAAFLAIIPYVGTTIGGLLPTIYAFITCDSIWYPIGVIIIFGFVQFLEGNFLNPKIVGGNLNVNALVAIISLILGNLIWGIPGMILFLPFMAIFKVVAGYYKTLKPLNDIIGDNLTR